MRNKSLYFMQGITATAVIALAALLMSVSPSPAGERDWSGAYVGVLGSYSDNNISASALKIDGTAVPGTTQSANVDGALFGIQAGYGRQIGQFYIGAEGDWQWGDLDRDIANGGFNTTYSTDQIATARARVGYIWGQFMPYVTGGVALKHGAVGAYIDGAPLSLSASSWQVGYAVGGGLEFRPSEHWLLKVEALYTDFGENSLASANIAGHSVDLVSVRDDGAQVRIGAAYRF